MYRFERKPPTTSTEDASSDDEQDHSSSIFNLYFASPLWSLQLSIDVRVRACVCVCMSIILNCFLFRLIVYLKQGNKKNSFTDNRSSSFSKCHRILKTMSIIGLCVASISFLLFLLFSVAVARRVVEQGREEFARSSSRSCNERRCLFLFPTIIVDSASRRCRLFCT